MIIVLPKKINRKQCTIAWHVNEVKEFNEVEDLKMHTEVLHRGKTNPGKKPFLCNNCTKIFASKQGLKAHIFQYHVGSRQYSYWYHS